MKMVNGTVTELVCTDGRKSFYGKAKVVTHNGVKTLYSYNTAVAKIGKNGKFTIDGCTLTDTNCYGQEIPHYFKNKFDVMEYLKEC